MITAILGFFAFAGSLLVNSIFVVAATASIAICCAIFACQIMLWIAKYGVKQSFVDNSALLGALAGFIWGIVAICNLSLWSSILSVLGLCACILFVSWCIWMADEIKGHPIPDNA